MQPRLQRYKQFIETQFIESLLWNNDYSIEGLDSQLRSAIESGKFTTIIFTGMGCSAIVSDLIKGFFIDHNIPVHIEVVNDYNTRALVDKNILKDEKTLIIVSSYSGHSREPIKFYENIKDVSNNIIFLTSGGQLGEIAEQKHVSIIRWRLRSPDREYPLFHVPQYFSILLNIFAELKILKSNFQNELKKTAQYLKGEFGERKIKQTELLAERLRDCEIVFLANPKWYTALLKLADMHVNEMSMIPAHRNYFHEFTHSEVAVFTNPQRKLSVVVLRDEEEDEYTTEKMDRLKKLLSDRNAERNRNIEYIELLLNQKDFFKKFFSTLLYLNYVAYFLGVYTDTESRELISTTAGNPWYNQKTIQTERGV